jgi:hypothetical protein
MIKLRILRLHSSATAREIARARLYHALTNVEFGLSDAMRARFPP